MDAASPLGPDRATAGEPYDVIVIGSGFGGAIAASELVAAGRRVLMVERGGWLPRGPENWTGEGAFVRTPAYAKDTTYQVFGSDKPTSQNLCACVGGASVFYGGASFRFREADFGASPEIVGESGAAWPITYDELEPYYAQAERMLGISGQAGEDPTEPRRSTEFPHAPAPLAATSKLIADAARRLGHRPFRIPMALNLDPAAGPTCQQCTTCDAFACAIGAKNDIATRIIPRLVAGGMTLLTDTVVTRLVAEDGRIIAIEAVGKNTGIKQTLTADTFVLAAGALATPHLLLASGLDRLNPAGDKVGRFLMRHCNAMTYGLFLRSPNPKGEHHKQIALHDFYAGADDPLAPPGKLGNLQQVMGPHPGLIGVVLPKNLAWVAGPAGVLARRLTGLLAVAEDQPREENRVRIDPAQVDGYGLPAMIVEHRYTRRDLAARDYLIKQARRILRAAGAKVFFTWQVSTFSHALGTVRMGSDPQTAPLDASCKYRGLDNLYVSDASVFPTSAGVNPSLTVAANALRVGRAIVAATVGAASARRREAAL